MKKIKGFTLIELLAVILIIGLIGGIALKFVLDVSKDAKKRSYTEFENIIKSAAYSYIINNDDLLNNIKSSSCENSKKIDFNILVQKKYLSRGDLINPTNNKMINIESSYVKVYYGKGEFMDDGSCPLENNSNDSDYDYRYYVNIVDKE